MKRRSVLTLAGLGPMALLQGAAGGKLPDVTKDAGEAKVTKESFGVNRVYFDGPTEQLKWLTAGSLQLNPGSEPHPPHHHPEEEIMVVTEGSGEIVVDGKTTQVHPGAMMFCAGGKTHGIKNTGSAPLFFYYYKWRSA